MSGFIKHYVTVEDEKLTLSQAVDKHGVEGLTPPNLYKRLEKGIPVLEALKNPVNKSKSHVSKRPKQHPRPVCPKINVNINDTMAAAHEEAEYQRFCDNVERAGLGDRFDTLEANIAIIHSIIGAIEENAKTTNPGFLSKTLNRFWPINVEQ